MPYCWKSHAPALIDFNSFSSTTTKLAWNIWASTRENLSLGVSEQHRRRPAYASAQSDQRLCYSRFVKYNIYACYQWNFSFLASLCSWGDWFETRFVGNPEYIFSRDVAHIMLLNIKIPPTVGIQTPISMTSTTLESQKNRNVFCFLSNLNLILQRYENEKTLQARGLVSCLIA